MPRTLYPPIEPYRTGYLAVGDGQRVWWEESGNPDGVPLLALHGGPGGGSVPAMRRPYDPTRYRIVMFDQRGCGRSEPHASDPQVSLATNTTWHLVDEIERLRVELGVARWVLSGGSWGTALALAYAQRHRQRVVAMVLHSIFTLRASELDWVYRDGASRLLPERWSEFSQAIPADKRHDLVSAYRRRLASTDSDVRVATARAWTRWETAGMLADPTREALFAEPRFAVAFARIENHYIAHGGFVEQGQLIEDARHLVGIPAVILQGRYDLCTPPVTAWDLHHAWPGSELHIIEEEGHRLTGATAQLIDATNRFASFTC